MGCPESAWSAKREGENASEFPWRLRSYYAAPLFATHSAVDNWAFRARYSNPVLAVQNLAPWAQIKINQLQYPNNVTSRCVLSMLEVCNLLISSFLGDFALKKSTRRGDSNFWFCEGSDLKCLRFRLFVVSKENARRLCEALRSDSGSGNSNVPSNAKEKSFQSSYLSYAKQRFQKCPIYNIKWATMKMKRYFLVRLHFQLHTF